MQRHRARRLHYDFRLEIDGVLVSWAVPKGPTLDPGARRAAFHVEDHPLDYFDFEGVIPAGQYGGGDVIVWDVGTWQPHPHRRGRTTEPGQAVRDGELHLDMVGEKLRGRFVLVRTGKQASGNDWLMLHKRDEFAVEGWDAEDHPHSVLTGRTNDQVKADPDRLWRSDLPADRASVRLKLAPVTPDELDRLDSLRSSGVWHVFDRDLRVTNLDRQVFPSGATTKRDLLRYTAQIAPTVLPYLTNRAMTLHKRLPAGAPDWLTRWESHLVVDEPAALIWATNFGSQEWRPSAFRVDQPELPTYALVDLDPDPGTSWADVLVLARLHRTAFEHLRVTARPMVTGMGGIHIWVPIAPGPSLEEIQAWVLQLTQMIDNVAPELARSKPPKAPSIAPYSPRSVAGGPVSAPIDWDELDDPSLAPDEFTVGTMPQRVAQKGDLFRDVLHHTQHLPRLQ